ncbi:hypothetical protein V2G26_021464 [Clonostachys chloroleuca]
MTMKRAYHSRQVIAMKLASLSAVQTSDRCEDDLVVSCRDERSSTKLPPGATSRCYATTITDLSSGKTSDR